MWLQSRERNTGIYCGHEAQGHLNTAIGLHNTHTDAVDLYKHQMFMNMRRKTLLLELSFTNQKSDFLYDNTCTRNIQEIKDHKLCVYNDSLVLIINVFFCLFSDNVNSHINECHCYKRCCSRWILILIWSLMCSLISCVIVWWCSCVFSLNSWRFLLHDLQISGSWVWRCGGSLFLSGHYVRWSHVHPRYHWDTAGECCVL